MPIVDHRGMSWLMRFQNEMLFVIRSFGRGSFIVIANACREDHERYAQPAKSIGLDWNPWPTVDAFNVRQYVLEKRKFSLFLRQQIMAFRSVDRCCSSDAVWNQFFCWYSSGTLANTIKAQIAAKFHIRYYGIYIAGSWIVGKKLTGKTILKTCRYSITAEKLSMKKFLVV